MLFTTPEQFIVLAVMLLGGVLIGYASAPSPKKWKRRVREQSDSFTEYHTDAEDRLRAANQRAADLSVEAEALRADHAEAERTIAALRAAAVVPIAPAQIDPVEPEPAPRPALALVEATPVPVGATDPIPAESAAPQHIEPVAESDSEPEPETPEPEAIAEHVVEAVEQPSATTQHEIVEAVPDPQLTAELVPDHHQLLADHPIEPEAVVEPEPVAAPDPEPIAEPEPEPVADTAPLPEPDHGHPVFQPLDIVPMTPTPTAAVPAPIGPAESEMPDKGWFASSARDDLTRLRGIDDVLNTRLFGLGVVRFEDLEKLSAEDEMALEQRLALPVGYIAREQWRTQAALLRAGQDEEHAAHFAATEPVPTT